MKNLLFSIFLTALATTAFIPVTTLAGSGKTDITVGKAPIVIELYTSQGCSSCPPAEKILGQLSAHPKIFALSCHVTYWDYLGWKDTFGNQSCTDRQLSFMKTRGKDSYYTPQMVVNGVDEFPGHRSNEIKSAIEKANKNPVAPISLSHKNRATIIAGLPYVPAQDYTLWVFGYQKAHDVDIRSGENKGKKLVSTNTVRMLESLGKWRGGQEMKRFDIGNTNDIDGVVVVAQKGGYGPIIASGRLEF